MTQKEKLYEQLLIASNEYKQLSEKSEMIVDINAIKRDSSFSAYAKMHTLSELKGSLYGMKHRIRDLKATKARDEFFATPEGAKIKDELEAQLAEKEDSLLFSLNRHITMIYELIYPHLGENWEVCSDNARYIHFYLLDANHGTRVFGHNFTILLDVKRKCGSDEEIGFAIRTIMGSLCNFDPIKDSKGVSFYKTFAEIVSNQGLIEALKSIMANAYHERKHHEGNIREIKMRLQNSQA